MRSAHARAVLPDRRCVQRRTLELPSRRGGDQRARTGAAEWEAQRLSEAQLAAPLRVRRVLGGTECPVCPRATPGSRKLAAP